MHEYETVFILDPGLDENRVNEEIEKAQTLLSGQGGEVLQIERWGRKRLAYEIQKKRDGIYTLVRHRSSGDAVRELERRLRLNDAVIRVMTVIAGPEVEVPEEGEAAAVGVGASAGAPAASETEGVASATGGAPSEALPRQAVVEEAAE